MRRYYRGTAWVRTYEKKPKLGFQPPSSRQPEKVVVVGFRPPSSIVHLPAPDAHGQRD
jgi:hypothetical protein